MFLIVGHSRISIVISWGRLVIFVLRAILFGLSVFVFQLFAHLYLLGIAGRRQPNRKASTTIRAMEINDHQRHDATAHRAVSRPIGRDEIRCGAPSGQGECVVRGTHPILARAPW